MANIIKLRGKNSVNVVIRKMSGQGVFLKYLENKPYGEFLSKLSKYILDFIECLNYILYALNSFKIIPKATFKVHLNELK